MPEVMDVFDTDMFNMVSLTDAINKLPYQPSRIGQLNLFEPVGITTTSAMIEEQHGRLSLIPTAPRGSMPTMGEKRTRKGRSFAVPHIPKNDAVMADDVQNVRAFGSETRLETISSVVNTKLEQLKQDHETTWEWHRLGAVKGVVYDADGTDVVYNWFTEFGITQYTVNLNTGTSGAVKSLANDIRRRYRQYLGQTPFSEIRVVCGSTLFDHLTTCAEVKDAYDRWLEGKYLRDSQVDTGFEYAGVFWEEYAGSLGSDDFVGATKGHVFPTGVRGLFKRINAPGTFTETVNTVGKPMYAKQERMRFDVGVELHTQSNPLFICTRPQVLIQITDTTS